MLTEHKRRVLTVSGVLAFVALVWLLTRPPEAAYDGRSLTQWTALLGSPATDEEAQAFAAIEAMGTNALPTIVRLLGSRDSALETSLS
jgi:hypothetical protein